MHLPSELRSDAVVVVSISSMRMCSLFGLTVVVCSCSQRAPEKPGKQAHESGCTNEPPFSQSMPVVEEGSVDVVVVVGDEELASVVKALSKLLDVVNSVEEDNSVVVAAVVVVEIAAGSSVVVDTVVIGGVVVLEDGV